MFNRLSTIFTSLALVMAMTSSAMAAVFADRQLVRVVYERITGTSEYVTAIGDVVAVAGSPAGSGSGGTFAGTFGAVSNPANLYAVYFAIDHATNEMWVSGSMDISKAPVAVGTLGMNVYKSGSTSVFSYYNSGTITADANGVFAGAQSYGNSYKSKLAASQGALGNAINIATRVNSEANLEDLVNASATTVKQLLYYFANGNTANSVGVPVATITNNANGSTTIGPKVVSPTVSLLSPASLGQGAVQATVTISGTGFASNAAVTFSGEGITTGAVEFVDSTTIKVPVTVAADAPKISCNVTVTNGDGGFTTKAGSFTVSASQQTPTITWSAPTAITYGTALSTTQLSATASVPGTFAYSPGEDSVFPAGTHELSVNFTPTDVTYASVTKTVSLTVNPAPLTITAANESRTYGAANPATSYTATGLVAPDSITSVTNTIAASATATAAAVSSHAITPSAAVFDSGLATNYTITYVPGTLTIDKAVLTFTADTLTKTLNSANPPLTYTVSGFANGENSAVLNGTIPAISTTALTGSPVGDYPITVTAGTLAATNYSFAFVSGTLTITSKTVPVITWAAPAAITYGTPLYATQLNATAKDPDTAANVPGTFVYTPAAGTVLPAGTQTITVTFNPTASAVYASVTGNTSLTVNKAALTITAANASRAYGAANPVVGFTPAGLAAPDTVTSVTNTFSANATTTVGDTAITIGAAVFGVGSADNYTITYVPGTLTITKAVLTVTADNLTKTVNSPNPTLTYTITGYQNNETSAVLNSTTPTLGTTADTSSPVGVYPITVSAGTLAAANYSFSTVNGTLTIANNTVPLITWDPPAGIKYGAALTGVELSAKAKDPATSAGITGTFVYTPPLGSVPNAGTQTLSVTFTPDDNIKYSPVTATVSLHVAKGVPVITWTAPLAIDNLTPLSDKQLNATASVPGTFVYNPGSGTVLQADIQKLTAVFTPTDAINYQSVTATVDLTVLVWYPIGALNGSATPTVADALKVLKYTLGLATLTDQEKVHVDVAPLVDGKPAPDGRIDLGDTLVILKRVVGSIPAW